MKIVFWCGTGGALFAFAGLFGLFTIEGGGGGGGFFAGAAFFFAGAAFFFAGAAFFFAGAAFFFAGAAFLFAGAAFVVAAGPVFVSVFVLVFARFAAIVIAPYRESCLQPTSRLRARTTFVSRKGAAARASTSGEDRRRSRAPAA
jgi:hypothetical protein